jgi:thiol:disulfide interchange protein DsbD
MRLIRRGILVIVLACLSAAVHGQLEFGLGSTSTTGPAQGVLEVTNYWSQTGVKPGGRIDLALVLDIRKPYHIGANKTKEDAIPTTIDLVEAPPQVQSTTPLFPPSHDFELVIGAEKEKLPVFSGRAIVYIPIAVASSAQPGDMPLAFKIHYQACDDRNCLPPKDLVTKATLQVLPSATSATAINQEIFSGMRTAKEQLTIAFFGWDFRIEPTKLWLLLLVAAVGGMLLNFTPCVLPLIPIKIIGLSRTAGNRTRCLLLGLSLSAGVVAFWLGLAAAVSTISGFNATNKLFQYPAFTISVGVIICLMAVGMCGLFAVTLPQWVYGINPSQESMPGSFVFGIMTAILSTPCTAPFMGAAAAWSATQRPAITLGTFSAIGAGMALPYLLLSAFPVLVHKVPRSGPASDLIKQVMGLLMFGAGAYFLGTGLAGAVARPPDPPSQAYWWAVAFFVGAAGVWLAWRTFQITQGPWKRLWFGALGVCLVASALALGVRFTEGSPVHWVYYTPERLADAQKQNQIVVLEFTAAWCLNCHALEQAVLHNKAVVAMLNTKGVTPIKVDITGNNPRGDQKLIEVGRRTIPFLVVYGPDGKQIFASDAYTVEQLTRALKQAQL